MIKNNKNHKGLSLIELLLVVGLAALILAGMFVAYNKISENNIINNEVTMVSLLRSESKIYAQSSKYSSLSNSDFFKLKIVDSSKILTNGLIKSEVSDGISVDTVYNNQDRVITHLKLSFNNFRGEYCARFIQSIENQADFISLERTIVKNKFDSNNIKEYDFPFTATYCDQLYQQYGTFPLVLTLRYS